MSDIKWTNEQRRLGDLIEWESNPRKSTKKQVEYIQESMRKFGQVHTFVISPKNEIYDGHQRKAAAELMENFGDDAMVDVRVSSRELTMEERKQLIIFLHEGATGEWDFEGLGALYVRDELEDWGMDKASLRKVVFGTEDLPEDPGVNIELADKLKEKWGVGYGQLWKLGNHLVLCGDATNPEDVARLEMEAGIMVTDPPYGVNYDPEWRAEAGVSKKTNRMDTVENDDRVDWSEAYKLFTGDVVYVWHAGMHTNEVQMNIEECGFEVVSHIIWAKDRFALSRGDYHWQHEHYWYAVRKGRTHSWAGARDQSTIWEIARNQDAGYTHSTQKPLEAMERPLRNHTFKSCYDPFIGTGTTLVAAERQNMRCYGIDIMPKYVAVTIERWHEMTGGMPELIS